MPCPKNTIQHTRGDSISITGVVLADNVPMDITGATIVFTVRSSTAKTGDPILQETATIDNATA